MEKQHWSIKEEIFLRILVINVNFCPINNRTLLYVLFYVECVP